MSKFVTAVLAALCMAIAAPAAAKALGPIGRINECKNAQLALNNLTEDQAQHMQSIAVNIGGHEFKTGPNGFWGACAEYEQQFGLAALKTPSESPVRTAAETAAPTKPASPPSPVHVAAAQPKPAAEGSTAKVTTNAAQPVPHSTGPTIIPLQQLSGTNVSMFAPEPTKKEPSAPVVRHDVPAQSWYSQLYHFFGRHQLTTWVGGILSVLAILFAVWWLNPVDQPETEANTEEEEAFEEHLPLHSAEEPHEEESPAHEEPLPVMATAEAPATDSIAAASSDDVLRQAKNILRSMSSEAAASVESAPEPKPSRTRKARRGKLPSVKETGLTIDNVVVH